MRHLVFVSYWKDPRDPQDKRFAMGSHDLLFSGAHAFVCLAVQECLGKVETPIMFHWRMAPVDAHLISRDGRVSVFYESREGAAMWS